MKIFYYEPLGANPSEIFTELTNGKTVSIAELAKWYEKRNKEEPERWITTRNKVRVPIFKGQSEDQAIEQFFKKKDKAAQQPKIFKDGQDANNYFYNNESYKKWADSLSEDEKYALKEYTDTLFLHMNEQLRSGNVDKGIQEYVDILDGMIERFNLEQPIQVYRVVNPKYIQDILYTDEGFFSTTTYKNAFPFSDKAFLIINIPAGKGRGAYINDYSLYKNQEYEFLIKRNSRFKIKSKHEENGRLIVEMNMEAD